MEYFLLLAVQCEAGLLTVAATGKPQLCERNLTVLRIESRRARCDVNSVTAADETRSWRLYGFSEKTVP